MKRLIGYSVQSRNTLDLFKPNEELGFTQRLDQALDLIDLVESSLENGCQIALYAAYGVPDTDIYALTDESIELEELNLDLLKFEIQ